MMNQEQIDSLMGEIITLYPVLDSPGRLRVAGYLEALLVVSGAIKRQTAFDYIHGEKYRQFIVRKTLEYLYGSSPVHTANDPVSPVLGDSHRDSVG